MTSARHRDWDRNGWFGWMSHGKLELSFHSMAELARRNVQTIKEANQGAAGLGLSSGEARGTQACSGDAQAPRKIGGAQNVYRYRPR